MADEPNYIERENAELARKRSMVRQGVTYAAIYTYLGLASMVVLWLM